jgi:hypothetical protein
MIQIPFLKRIGEYRTKELKYIRTLLIIRSLSNAVAFSLPVLSSVVAFIVYSATGVCIRLFTSIIFAFQLICFFVTACTQARCDLCLSFSIPAPPDATHAFAYVIFLCTSPSRAYENQRL